MGGSELERGQALLSFLRPLSLHPSPPHPYPATSSTPTDDTLMIEPAATNGYKKLRQDEQGKWFPRALLASRHRQRPKLIPPVHLLPSDGREYAESDSRVAEFEYSHVKKEDKDDISLSCQSGLWSRRARANQTRHHRRAHLPRSAFASPLPLRTQTRGWLPDPT